jgi:hypothetical protein
LEFDKETQTSESAKTTAMKKDTIYLLCIIRSESLHDTGAEL